jgi:hypothetical protein
VSRDRSRRTVRPAFTAKVFSQFAFPGADIFAHSEQWKSFRVMAHKACSMFISWIKKLTDFPGAAKEIVGKIVGGFG